MEMHKSSGAHAPSRSFGRQGATSDAAAVAVPAWRTRLRGLAAGTWRDGVREWDNLPMHLDQCNCRGDAVPASRLRPRLLSLSPSSAAHTRHDETMRHGGKGGSDSQIWLDSRRPSLLAFLDDAGTSGIGELLPSTEGYWRDGHRVSGIEHRASSIGHRA
ncbi:hypothetical protein RJ55_06233 [Drechmeria coniospora]|nr:hypothetical protein RJ55_06233 [Drechmeria coniospora]